MRLTYHLAGLACGMQWLSVALADPAAAWQELLALEQTAKVLTSVSEAVQNTTFPQTGPAKTFTRRYEASYPKGQPRPATLAFKKVESFSEPDSLSLNDRTVLINCPVHVTETYTVTGHGTWWTGWCHDPLNVEPGAFLGITEAASTTVTFSADASLGGEIADYIGATVGFSVEVSKSFGRSYGCSNDGNQEKAVWWQEKMGWAQTQVDTEIQDCDGGASTSTSVHSDFPDPDNTGVREFKAGCGSPVSNTGPYCNFQASHL